MNSRRGMFGQPGQREYVEGGTGRILTTVKWTSLWSLGVLFLLFVDALILGPWVGWVVGLLVMCRMSRPVYLWTRSINNRYAYLVVSSVMVAILLVYAIVGYPALAKEWPPYRLPIPLWADLCLLAISLALKVALGWGIWGMWAELIDPGGPTAPRVAVPRDTLILPWGKHKETYGGARLPPVDRPALPPIMPYRRIKLTLVDEQNHIMAFADLEDSERMVDFAKAMKAGKSFCERTATSCGFSRRAWEREIRDPFLERDWAYWKDEMNQKLGLELTDVGYDFCVKVADEDFEDAIT